MERGNEVDGTRHRPGNSSKGVSAGGGATGGGGVKGADVLGGKGVKGGVAGAGAASMAQRGSSAAMRRRAMLLQSAASPPPSAASSHPAAPHSTQQSGSAPPAAPRSLCDLLLPHVAGKLQALLSSLVRLCATDWPSHTHLQPFIVEAPASLAAYPAGAAGSLPGSSIRAAGAGSAARIHVAPCPVLSFRTLPMHLRLPCALPALPYPTELGSWQQHWSYRARFLAAASELQVLGVLHPSSRRRTRSMHRTLLPWFQSGHGVSAFWLAACSELFAKTSPYL
ncbi:unnamed protein product [Closterium sp. Naga37s-1]|nr:unnamed protein product [Closterium sp. Naga37s-1]